MSEGITSTAAGQNAHVYFDNTFIPRARSFLPSRKLATWQAMSVEDDALASLMERYASGEDSVFEELYRALAPRLHRFCLRLAPGQPEADDCFQETFLKLHRARATYARGANVSYWAFAIARSVYLSRLRYWRRRPDTIGASADVAEREDLRAVEAATPEAEVHARFSVSVRQAICSISPSVTSCRSSY